MVLALLIKPIFYKFWSVTHEKNLSTYWNFNAKVQVFQRICFKMLLIFSQKVVIILINTAHKTCTVMVQFGFKLKLKESKGVQGPQGGHSTFFQVGVCGPDFRSVGLANWHLPLKRGACERKFPNLGACELKISKFGGLWAKIWVKIEAVKAKISKFSQKGVLWTDFFAWNGTLASGRRGVKRGSSGPHDPIPPF